MQERLPSPLFAPFFALCSLDTIYSQEGLPPRTPIRPGEAKHLAATETQQFVRQIGEPQVIPRKPIQPANPKGKQKP